MSAGRMTDSVDLAIKDVAEARSLIHRAMNPMAGIASDRFDHDMRSAFTQVDLVLEQLTRARAALDGVGL